MLFAAVSPLHTTFLHVGLRRFSATTGRIDHQCAWPALPGWGSDVVGLLHLALVVIGLLVGVSAAVISMDNYNGSGTALAMALAAAVGERLDISPVFTGSEETGTRGMMHFMSHFTSSRQTYFVNLDNLGDAFHATWKVKACWVIRLIQLINLAKQVSKRMSGRVVAKHNLLLPTDGVIAARAGYPAIRLLRWMKKEISHITTGSAIP